MKLTPSTGEEFLNLNLDRKEAFEILQFLASELANPSTNTINIAIFDDEGDYELPEVTTVKYPIERKHRKEHCKSLAKRIPSSLLRQAQQEVSALRDVIGILSPQPIPVKDLTEGWSKQLHDLIHQMLNSHGFVNGDVNNNDAKPMVILWWDIYILFVTTHRSSIIAQTASAETLSDSVLKNAFDTELSWILDGIALQISKKITVKPKSLQ